MELLAQELEAAFHLHQAGRLSEAEQVYRRILDAEPNHAHAWHLLGALTFQCGNYTVAVRYLKQSLSLNPNDGQALNTLGLIFDRQGQREEAARCYAQSVEVAPTYAEAHYNLGNAFDDRGQLDEAIACYRKALAIQPTFAEVYNNLGTALRDQGEFDEAAACLQRALELAPNNGRAHCNRACLRLLQGDFEHGWSEYEWRWKTGELAERNFPSPRWNGELLTNKVILLHAEQGLGDTIQFIRYAAIVKEFGGTVLVQCASRLRNVLSSCPGIDHLISYGDTPPPFDFHAPLLSVPGILKTSQRNIPSTVPYLSADSNLVAEWARRLDPIQGFRIGINWHGRTGNAESRKRDIPRDLFVSLAQLPGLQLISLQKKAGQDLTAAPADLPIVDLGPDIDVSHGAFMDTAAIIANLDLVISSDTSIPHLAGAQGVPVWVGLPFVPDWRWFLDRTDSPWYPTMRLFRQKKPGDWMGVFDEIKAELEAIRRG